MDKLERLNEDDKFRTDYNVDLVRRKEINSARLDGYGNGYDNGYDSGYDTGKTEGLEEAKNQLLKIFSI